MSSDELKQILADHALWLANNGGKNADLCWANLYRVSLRGADLRGVSLRGANMREVDLREADLREADLREVDLRGADMHGVSLRGANLSMANLRGADGIIYAQCSFTAHGESGRQLLGVVIDGRLQLFCGCFSGTLQELDAYIEKGKECYKPTRKLARDFIAAAIDAARKEQP